MQAFSKKCAFKFLQARSDLIGNIHTFIAFGINWEKIWKPFEYG